MELCLRAARQAARFPGRQVLHPELAQCRIQDAPLVGGDADPAQHLHVERVGGHLLREPNRVGDDLRDTRGERDRRRPPALDFHAPDLSLRPDHNALAVRRPRVARVGAEDGPRLLLVTVQPVPQRALTPTLHVVQHQHTLPAHPTDEGHCLASAGCGRNDPPAPPTRCALPCLPVEPLHHVDDTVRIAVVLEATAGDTSSVKKT